MFKIPYTEIEKDFTRNKQLIQGLFKDKGLNADFYGTQITFSYADRIAIFLPNYPAITNKIQSLVLQDYSDENIIRRVLISLINKEFGEFDTFQHLRISIAIIISITSGSKIDYPYEIVDINYNQTAHDVKLLLFPLLKFLNNKSIVLLICGLSYIIEELHINENFQYTTEDIEKTLSDLKVIERSDLWNNGELAYQFLIRLNFYIQAQIDSNQSSSILLIYLIKALYFEIDYFHSICDYFAINRWNSIFSIKKIYDFSRNISSNIIYSIAKPFYPIFSSLEKAGFRITIGQSRNTGFGTVGVNPVTFKLVKLLSVGDQIKLNFPFSTYQVQIVDIIEGPFVQLKSKNCVRLNSLEDFYQYENQIEKILTFGDLLIDKIDIPSTIDENKIGFSHKRWVNLAIQKLQLNFTETIEVFNKIFKSKYILENYFSSISVIKSFLLKNEKLVTSYISIELYKKFNILIHPKWTPRWDKISNKEWRIFRKWIINSRYWEKAVKDQQFLQIEGEYDEIVLEVLKKGEISFFLNKGKILISDYGSIFYFIFLDKTNDFSEIEPSETNFNPLVLLNNSNKIYFEKETNYRVNFSLNSINSIFIDSLKTNAHGFYPDPINEDEVKYIKDELNKIDNNLSIEKVNFVKSYEQNGIGKKESLLLKKTLLRAKHNLNISKDGLIHFSLISAPLNIVKPTEVNLNINQLHSLGYYYDKDGKLIESTEQEVLLKPYDVIVPEAFLNQILEVMSFINDELKIIFNASPFYDLKAEKNSILGINIIGINKNYSVGVYGRIIGYTSLSVLFAPPIWHLSKGSYCNGEMTDSFVLDMDCFLNLDLSLLVTKAGMLRGIPLFTQLEPDLEIAKSLVEQKMAEKPLPSISNYINDVLVHDESQNVINNLIFNDFYKKRYYFEFVKKIDKIKVKNELKDIYEPIEQISIIFSNCKLFGTINNEEIFNFYVIYYLNNYILPEINDFFKKSYVCPGCNSKIVILMNSTCPSCNKKIELSNSILSISNKLGKIKGLIKSFPELFLNEFTKELLAFCELQMMIKN